MLTKALLSGLLLCSAGTASLTVPRPPSQGLRLVKTFEDDAGTWMTEEEKFALIKKHVHFVDITETFDLEKIRLSIATQKYKRQASFPEGPSQQAEAEPIIAAIEQSKLEASTKAMTDLFSRSYLSEEYAAPASQLILDSVREAASANPDISVEPYKHTSWNQDSVIAKIPGTSSDVVIVSAHFDSVNGDDADGRAPGADDNASGIAVILESLRVLAGAKYAPKNTLEFHFYAAEEGGLLGSRAIMQDYARSNVSVRALVNQDMTGFSPNNVIAVYTDFVDPELTRFVQTLVPAYSSLPLSTDECGYGCSDHASARDAGFPAAYVCDENMADSSPYIHSAKDAYDTLDFAHMVEHTKFTVGFLVEGANF